MSNNNYIIMNKFLLLLFLLCAGLNSFAQGQVNVKGLVIAKDDGKPVPGASVFVDKSTIGEQTNVPGVIQNSAIGTVTDVNGRFSLNVPEGTTYIRISFLGFESQLVNIRNKSNVNVVLESGDNKLNEVIVTGYNDIQKRKNTTASAVVDYAKIRQTGVSGVDQMLQGQVAGVAVTTTNGGPNAAPKIRIRGTASLQGSQDPLWVLDGIPLEGTSFPGLNLTEKDQIDQLRNFPIAGLNPDDIDNISILKDAAATAIYGVRAANGVIVITTKKGKKGPMQVGFSANTFIGQRTDLGKLNLMNSAEKVDWELGLAAREDLTYRSSMGGVSRILDQYNELSNYRANGFAGLSQPAQDAINALRNTNTNWGKELFQTTLNQQYSASLSGGSDQANYYFSGAYYDEKGSTIGTGLKRYNVTLETDFNLSSKLKAGVALFGTSADRSGYLTETSAFTNPSKYSRTVNPYLSIRDANGAFAYDPDIVGGATALEDVYLPFNTIEERENTDYSLNNKSLKGLFDLSWQILPSLKARTELGLQFEDNRTNRYGGQDSYYNRKIRFGSYYRDGGVLKYFLPEGGILENTDQSFFQYNWKGILEYNRTFNEKHELELLGGSELRRTNNDSFLSRGFGYNPLTLTTKPIIFPEGSSSSDDAIYRGQVRTKQENAFASFYGIASYTYDRRYTVYGSLRYDGSDFFGVDPKYKWLPVYSISGAWNAKEESFLKDQNWLSNLRLRSSYGIQGNIDKTTSPYLIGNYENQTILPGYPETSLTVSSPQNDKLRWEKTSTFNGGLDFGIFRNAIQLTVDYYRRDSEDLIGAQELSPETGFSFTNRNWAKIRNSGIELSLSTRNITTPKFSWSTDFNFAHNKSEVIREDVRDDSLTPSREGYPVNSLFVIKTAGLDAQGYPQFTKDGQVLSYEDFFKLYDPWADFAPGYLVESTMATSEYKNLFTYAGNLDPKYTGGFINRFRYSNFDLTVTTSFSLDQMVLRSDSYNPAMVDRGENRSREILNAWSPQNTNSTLPGVIGAGTADGSRYMVNIWMSGNDALNSYRYFDFWAKSMSYLRVNSMRLGYTLPSVIARKIRANNLRISVEGNNLFVIGKNYDGYFDPETYGNIYAQPITKSINFGINASF